MSNNNIAWANGVVENGVDNAWVGTTYVSTVWNGSSSVYIVAKGLATGGLAGPNEIRIAEFSDNAPNITASLGTGRVRFSRVVH